eukprot:403334300
MGTTVDPGIEFLLSLLPSILMMITYYMMFVLLYRMIQNAKVAIASSYQNKNSANLDQQISNNPILYSILIVVLNLISDVIPYFSILELKFIDIFKKQQKEIDVQESDDEEDALIHNLTNNLSGMDFDQARVDSMQNKNHNLEKTPSQMLGNMRINDFDSKISEMNSSKNSDEKKESNATIENFRVGRYQEFSLIPERTIQQNLNIRQVSLRNNQKLSIEDQLLIIPKNYQLFEKFSKIWYQTDKDKKNRLGVFYKATLKQQPVLCRVLNFDRVTTYVIEDYFGELSRLKQIKMTKHTLFPLGYHIKESQISIFYKESMSLFELLYSKEREEMRKSLDYRVKYQICLDVAKIFYTLQQFNPPLCHGHLTSHNVFIELNKENLKVVLADLELMPLCKYANTFYDYRSASVWSPPECLKNMKKMDDPTPEMDTYSYGMLLWEIWHELIPFDNDLKLCQNYVVNEQSRPQIMPNEGANNGCDDEMAKLIRLCWQSEPEQRPKFNYICKLLSQIGAPQS